MRPSSTFAVWVRNVMIETCSTSDNTCGGSPDVGKNKSSAPAGRTSRQFEPKMRALFHLNTWITQIPLISFEPKPDSANP